MAEYAEKNHVILIGLTGGISSGKSTAARFFSELNISVIKADDIVHILLQPNTFSYQAIIDRLGKDIIQTDLMLNKTRLRQVIFTDHQTRLWLEELLHPQVYQVMAKQIASITSAYCVLEIPLLLEKPPPFAIDRILVVDCPVRQQISRTMLRDNIPKQVVQQVIAAQLDRHVRLASCHDTIINNGSLDDLKQAVRRLHERYLALSVQ